MKAYIFLIFLIPVCIDALSNCGFVPNCPMKKEYHQIMTTGQEIQDTCNDFAKYSKCIDDWGNECLGNRFASMRATYFISYQQLERLCKDNAYKTEYLQQSESLSKIKDTWNTCSGKVIDLGSEMLSSISSGALSVEKLEEKTKESCCTWLEYKSCVKDLCKDCSSKALAIYKELHSTVTNPNNKCDEICPEKSSSKRNTFNIIYLAISMMVYALIR